MRGSGATPAVAWLGGGLFVASLIYFGWSYFVRFGRVIEHGDVTLPLLVNLGLFGLFALHHSLLARSGAKRWLSAVVPAALERTLYVWVASLLFIAVCGVWREVPGLLYRQTGAWAAGHWLVVFAGLWLTIQSAAIIDPLELAGIRQATGHTLPLRFSVVGPYRFVRHPIYLGWALMVFGVPVMTGTRLAFAAISSIYLIVAIPFEERSLVEAFGEIYRKYRVDVRWRMFPGIW